MYSQHCNDGKTNEKVCEGKVFNAKTLPECHSENTFNDDICNSIVVKVPVLIAEPRIQIDIESDIKLDEPALEIKRIKKNLFLNQCKLIPITEKKGKLFISGFIRKNIEFATVANEHSSYYGLSGDIRHTTVKVPFECVTVVEFISKPEFCENGFTKEIEIFSNKLSGCDPCKELIGRDPCIQEFKNFECFTEDVFCELVDVKILEADIRKDPCTVWSKMPDEHLFNCFTEKMVVFLRLKLLQNQQVKMPKSSSIHSRKTYSTRRRSYWMKGY